MFSNRNRVLRSVFGWCFRLSAWWVLLFLGSGFSLAERHWAFEPVGKHAPPRVIDEEWPENAVDRFILSKLEAAHLRPARPALPERLARRVFLGVTGLPPTPAEVEAFVRDSGPGAWERLIDRLLGSPQYGERWGRHWLDLARFAESDGFEHDAIRPHAWRYRDYVIRSFNDDKPYDRFILEQIAGDELWPDDPPALIATGFNLLGPDMVDSADQTQRRLNTLNDATDTVSAVFLGLTLGCARCHDHKFEPFTQADYFSMQAFFAPAEFHRDSPVPTAQERERHAVALAKHRERTQPRQRQIEAIEAPIRRRLYDEKFAKLSEDAQAAHRVPKEKRTSEQLGTVLETSPQLAVSDTEVVRALTPVERDRRDQLVAELKREPRAPALPMAPALRNAPGAVPKTFILARGDYLQPGKEVVPDTPAILSSARYSPNEVNGTAQVRKSRAGLAHWMASPDNPLTARVLVNRVWQHHFGRGLVSTPGDFGTRGKPPSHPELLDWLAGEFVREGWSIKRLHKLILMSATYRQSSEASAESLERDPGNVLFSRQNRVRLEGEILRDSLLAAGGLLNLKQGGPGVVPPIPAVPGVSGKEVTASASQREDHRRSIYLFARRNLRNPFLEVFDAPDNNASCAERGQSTTAPQSLTLLNSREVVDASVATAERIQRLAGTESDQLELAFRLVLGRRPTGTEASHARSFLKEQHIRLRAKPDVVFSVSASTWKKNGSTLAPDDPIAALCRVLFNLNAFVYVD